MVPGRMPRRSLIHLAGGAALGALVPERLMAEELTHYEQQRLAMRDEIRVPLDLDLPQGSYFGGLVYQIIDAAVDEVMAIAGDPGTYATILSATREARVLSHRGRDTQVYLRQGEALASVSYVVLMRRETSNLLRFWLDPSQPHDLDDGWGYLRVEPWTKPSWLQMRARPVPRSVITWGVLLRIDSHELKLRYSEAIRRAAMETPGRIALRHSMSRASMSATVRRGKRVEK
jgi:hypothetical protein